MSLKIIKIITFAFLISILVLIWQTFEFYPEIGAIQEKTKNRETLIEDSEDTLRRVGDLREFVLKNQEIVDKFNAILPINEDKENLMSGLAALASVNGLGLSKISFEDKNKPENSQTQKQDNNNLTSKTIRMSLSGTYPSLKKFLISIENNLRIMNVFAVDFSGGNSKKEGEEVSYLYNIAIKTYLNDPVKNEDIAKILNSAEYKDFEVRILDFAKEKSFKELTLFPNYNIDINESDIGNQNIF